MLHSQGACLSQALCFDAAAEYWESRRAHDAAINSGAGYGVEIARLDAALDLCDRALARIAAPTAENGKDAAAAAKKNGGGRGLFGGKKKAAASSGAEDDDASGAASASASASSVAAAASSLASLSRMAEALRVMCARDRDRAVEDNKSIYLDTVPPRDELPAIARASMVRAILDDDTAAAALEPREVRRLAAGGVTVAMPDEADAPSESALAANTRPLFGSLLPKSVIGALEYRRRALEGAAKALDADRRGAAAVARGALAAVGLPGALTAHEAANKDVACFPEARDLLSISANEIHFLSLVSVTRRRNLDQIFRVLSSPSQARARV